MHSSTAAAVQQHSTPSPTPSCCSLYTLDDQHPAPRGLYRDSHRHTVNDASDSEDLRTVRSSIPEDWASEARQPHHAAPLPPAWCRPPSEGFTAPPFPPPPAFLAWYSQQMAAQHQYHHQPAPPTTGAGQWPLASGIRMPPTLEEALAGTRRPQQAPLAPPQSSATSCNRDTQTEPAAAPEGAPHRTHPKALHLSREDFQAVLEECRSLYRRLSADYRAFQMNPQQFHQQHVGKNLFPENISQEEVVKRVAHRRTPEPSSSFTAVCSSRGERTLPVSESAAAPSPKPCSAAEPSPPPQPQQPEEVPVPPPGEASTTVVQTGSEHTLTRHKELYQMLRDLETRWKTVEEQRRSHLKNEEGHEKTAKCVAGRDEILELIQARKQQLKNRT